MHLHVQADVFGHEPGKRDDGPFAGAEDRNSWEMTEMSLTQFVQRLFRDEEGQDLIEYALLATFVALVAIAGAQALGTALNGWYNSVANRVNSAASNQ
jgi:Flp pilus assembly pilin Flp